jgi:capsular exopolysaccharide synthesis family protein
MKQLLMDLLGRWYLLALGLAIGFMWGSYYLTKAPQLYQARATLLLKGQTFSVIAKSQMENMDFRTEEGMNTMAQRIIRPEMLRKVAARPEVRALQGLTPPPVEWMPDWALPWLGREKAAAPAPAAAPPPETLAAWISGWTSISIRPNTRLMDVMITHRVPEVAKTIANAICIEYQTELSEVRSSGRSSALQILVDESESAKKRLQVAQNALATYQRALDTLKELENRENITGEMSRRYLPKHPKMIAAMATQASVQQRFLGEFEAARNSAADREYWDSHAEEWQQAAGDDAAKLLTARRLLLARGNVLESEIASQTGVFNSILTHMQEIDINQQAVESEMEISSFAELPGWPIAPVRSKILRSASMGGLALGALLALLVIRLDNKIHTVSQAEDETGLPALAAIPQIPVGALAAAVRKRKIDPATIPDARKRWDPLLLFREGISNTTFTEMFRVLRASVSLLGDEKKRRVTLVSCALPGEGKTMISCNFALAAAQQGKRTLLIDLDLRRPAVHKMFGLKRDSHQNGATEVLSGQASFDDAIFTDTGADHLDIMLSGKKAPNPGELLNASSLKDMLDIAVSRYDLVVIDSSPLLPVPDARIIAPLVDNFCLVIRAEYVSKGAVRRTMSLLNNDNAIPCGIVFNGFSEKRRLIGQNYSYGNYQTNRYGQHYRYGYGSYGSYGSNEEDEKK